MTVKPHVVFFNGRFVSDTECMVSVSERGYLFGDAAFETLRGYGGHVFRLERHLERLAHSAQVLALRLPGSQETLAAQVREAVARSPYTDCAIRVTLSRGEGGAGISTLGFDTPVFSITVKPLRAYPEEAYARGIRTRVVSLRKVPPECLDPTIKSGGAYLPSIIARQELDREGMVEGVQLAVAGHVVSGLVSNVFAISGRRLLTPDLSSGCLPGITREALLQLAPSVGLEPTETRLPLEALWRADELFFANSLMECLPVQQLDQHPFQSAPGPLTRELRAALHRLIHQEKQASTGALAKE
ncbi:aminotransferase class IV [Stigmatella sp. ncwal1]|uniref:branched-chain-amino-acid transaminase n=1 Tax=Stigmatella ashevillensis TaxID=2995309 RepID=A0ABT5DG73_9BACT|nr:aminotransferase class IV [Stigmatella ashevillena]MDC0712613.1 aminotransferase class IV [Stigmatella ashevillena]